MKASILVGPQKSEVVDVPIPEIGAEEVLIRVIACGVCASELSGWIRGGRQQGDVENQPVTFGHEPVGVIESMGTLVRGFKVGDRVTGPIFKSFAEYTKVNYMNITKVPASLDDLEAFGEPLSCLMSGADRTPVLLGDDVAVVGAGFMGLGFLQLMQRKGAGRAIVIARREESLNNALRFGADEALLSKDIPEEYKVTDWGHIGKGIAITVDTTGEQEGLQIAGEICAVHGTVSVVGFHQSNGGMRNVNMEMWNWKALTIVNAHERRLHVQMKEMEAGLKLIANNRLNIKDMITHVYGLHEVDQAYQDMQNKPSGFIKAVIKLPS